MDHAELNSEVCNDGIDFANSFGQFLTFRRDVRRLAATVLYELSQKFSLDLDPSQAVNKNGFLGLHLRTSADAVKVKYPFQEW